MLGRALCLCLLVASATATAAPMRVAVMDFTDAAPGAALDALGKGLQSMITTDLSAAAVFELVERARLHDIQAELKLQRRAEFDPKTAVKIGKLAGASHLVIGSFTVVGDKMRLDCQLLAVQGATILLAEKVEGEKAAFFELEKTLVQKVIIALGAKVTPKDRAEVSKVHTADFEAFRKFGEGIGKYDEQKYDEAVTLLRAATNLDANFKLAQITLAGYEELIRKARADVNATRQAEAELARLQADKEMQLGAQIVERLYKITRSGSKQEKQVATWLLAEIHDPGYRVRGPLGTLGERGDRFARQRLSDNFYKAYWSTLAEVFPAVAPFPKDVSAPLTLNQFDGEFASAVAAMQRNAHRDTLDSTLIHNGILSLARCLHLDRRQRAAMLEHVYQLGLKLSPPAEWKQRMQRLLAEALQGVLDLDGSTAVLLQLQRSAPGSETLAYITEELEVNRELARALQEVKRKDELRELLRAVAGSSAASKKSAVKDIRMWLTGGALTTEAARELMRIRYWMSASADEYVLIGAEPTWAFNHTPLSTGPRSDVLRADEIRYFSGNPDNTSLLVTGAAPSDRFTLKLAVPFEPPLDWRLGQQNEFERYGKLKSEARRPTVSVLFGLRDLEHKERPLAGYAVRLTRGAVRLVKITAKSPGDRKLRDQLIAEWPAELATPKQLSVSVALDGKLLTVEVNGKRWSVPAPADAAGFLGLGIDGTGYVAIGGLQIVRS
ncbi:MAG TPA: CsgG/HfaB family protein [Kofleriaceae bacterium]|nr:CsgG/HfaB family protein [Kofleriaceae bacterium]